MGKFYILEFGGQHTDLIGNRLKAMGHTVEYAPSDAELSTIKDDANGIILSGGPRSVYDSDSFPFDSKIFHSNIPVLGICYGMQLMAHEFGGEVYSGGREYGPSRLNLLRSHPLLEGFEGGETLWNNHGDSVRGVEKDFYVLGITEKDVIAAMASIHGKNYAVQCHPELTHTEKGTLLLNNFAEEICGSKPSEKPVGSVDASGFIDDAIRRLKEGVGKRTALINVSGGVDSTDCLMIAERAGVKIRAVHHDMGIERKGEAKQVKRYLEDLYGHEVYLHDTSERTINALSGITDPEAKRKRLQQLYWQATVEVSDIFGIDLEDLVLIQGDLATDKRESGEEAGSDTKDTGTVAHIKTHHNVYDSEKYGLETLDLLGNISKDGSREIAAALELPEYIVQRPPFPGPGNTLRLITGIHPYDNGLVEGVCDMAEKYGLKGYALPIKTVGIKGDKRSLEHLALLTGEFGETVDWNILRSATKEMSEELPINRVVFMSGENLDFSQKDFTGISPLEFDKKNLSKLQRVTEIAEKIAEKYNVRYSQMPVVLFPGTDGPWVGIRDVDSVDFRSVRPLNKPEEMPWECCAEIAEKIVAKTDVTRVVYDVSTKPPGTTEWE